MPGRMKMSSTGRITDWTTVIRQVLGSLVMKAVMLQMMFGVQTWSLHLDCSCSYYVFVTSYYLLYLCTLFPGQNIFTKASLFLAFHKVPRSSSDCSSHFCT